MSARMAGAGSAAGGAPARCRTALLVIVVAAVALLVVMLSLRRIWTVDYWYQWRIGEYVAQEGVPREDVFSYTRAGFPQIELRWLYCLAIYHLSEWFGHAANVIAKVAIICVAFAVAGTMAADRRTIVAAALVTAIAALASSQRFFVRPEVVSHLLIIVFVCVIDRAMRAPTRWVYALPVVQVAWVNCHGLFVYGPALTGLWLACEIAAWTGRRVRRRAADDDARRRIGTAAALLALLLAASLVNPFGWRALWTPLMQFGVLHGTAQKELVPELFSPFRFMKGFSPAEYLTETYIAVRFYAVLLVLTVGSLLLNLRRQRLFWLLLVGSQLYLSLTAIRNLPLFCLPAVPFIIRNLRESEALARIGRAGVRRAAAAMMALLVIALCLYESRELATNRFSLRQHDTNQFGTGVAEHHYPLAGVRFLRECGAAARPFNSPAAGACLMAGHIPVFIDPRGEIYMDGLLDEFRELARQPSRLEHFAAKYDFNTLFLEPTMLPLIEHVRRGGEWRLVYVDSEVVIFFRGDFAAPVPTLRLEDGDTASRWFAELRSGLPPAQPYEERGWWTQLSIPAPYQRLARLCLEWKLYPQARALFEDARAAYPPRFDAWHGLAVATKECGDLEQAAEYYVRAAARDPGNAEIQHGTAHVLARLGRPRDALPYVDAALADRANDVETMTLKGVIEVQLWNFSEAESWLHLATEKDPTSAVRHRYLGAALVGLHRVDEAIAAYERSFALDGTNAAVARDLALLYSGARDYEQAVVWTRRAADLNPNDPQVIALRQDLERHGHWRKKG